MNQAVSCMAQDVAVIVHRLSDLLDSPQIGGSSLPAPLNDSQVLRANHGLLWHDGVPNLWPLL